MPEDQTAAPQPTSGLADIWRRYGRSFDTVVCPPGQVDGVRELLERFGLTEQVEVLASDVLGDRILLMRKPILASLIAA